jgi:DNA-binding CsgD family transcriptional regulator
MLALVLDRLPVAVMILDGGARPRVLNARAREILARNDGLGLAHGRLIGGTPVQTATLRNLIAIGAAKGALPADAYVVNRPSGERPYNIMVMPGCEGVEPGLVALAMADPDREPPVNLRWLQRFYGLTPTESRLAREIAAGRNVNEAAETLGISVGTARVHLKHIFDKTGTCRQGELVHLLLSAHAQIVERPAPGGR